MSDRSFLDWPFFAPSHRSLAESLEPWCEQHLSHSGEHHDTDATCRALVRALGRGGWLRYCVPASAGGALDKLDSRALVVLRETLAYHSPLADFAFAMQGLGSGAITLAGSPAQQQELLAPFLATTGAPLASLANSEPGGSANYAAPAPAVGRRRTPPTGRSCGLARRPPLGPPPPPVTRSPPQPEWTKRTFKPGKRVTMYCSVIRLYIRWSVMLSP